MSATGKTWTTTRRLGYFWHLARIWFRHEHKSIKDEIGSKIDDVKTAVENINLTPVEDRLDSLDEKISPYLYDECSVEEVNRMFETTTEDGLIIVPSGLITPEGTMPISVFKAITGLTPVN